MVEPLSFAAGPPASVAGLAAVRAMLVPHPKAAGGHEHDPAGRLADVRVLRRVRVVEGELVAGGSGAPNVGLVLDVETTGTGDDDPVIELAMRRFRYDDAGAITAVGVARSWFQDPGMPIPAEITRLTGIGDADVAGQAIDLAMADRLVDGADVVIAHHCRFDRPRVVRIVPAAADKAWACSMAEIDWRERGFEGRKLKHLLMESGWFHEGHRAVADVDAVIQLLQHRFDDGRTALAVLIARASQPSWLVRARGAHFDIKETLKRRGYAWDPDRKVWWREVYGSQRDEEEWWLAANVYASDARASAYGPEFVERDWTTRHG